MQKLLVSILIPFKNTAEFLGDCIQSVINQTYTNWELIIIDDNSTDAGFSIVENFAKKDSRVKLFKNPGNGIIEALQFAFSQSEGDLISRMDSDDIMRPNKLEIMASSLIQCGKGNLAVGLVHYFAEEGIKAGYKSYEIWLNALTEKGTNYSEIYKECVIPSPCWMLHRDDFIACDAFNPNRYPEDYDLAFRFYKHGLTCIPCNLVLHDWRDYSHRTSRTDEHYAANHFIPLKLDYFLELDYNPEKTLFVWGAGNKGKFIAKTLIEKQIDFEWICDNPKKIGKDIYGKILRPFKDLETIKNTQSIITVANKEAQLEIRSYLNALKLKSVVDYVFFC
ncbi:MAG: glycosyltransferase family 2 protein [Algibacter sp.]|uniref:glycosyltransferase family 2 protein n=1 Tax=Algibacter sp. TaxID=1872428 RepID=UPI00329A11E0